MRNMRWEGIGFGKAEIYNFKEMERLLSHLSIIANLSISWSVYFTFLDKILYCHIQFSMNGVLTFEVCFH